MKALLIQVDFTSGDRAGGINPRDPGLRGNPLWQDLEGKPGKEIRLIMDQRETKPYEGVKGVTVLDGTEAINQAIVEHFPPKAVVVDMTLLLAHAKEKGLALDAFAGKSMPEVAAVAIKEGLAGATTIAPQLVTE